MVQTVKTSELEVPTEDPTSGSGVPPGVEGWWPLGENSELLDVEIAFGESHSQVQ